ncbi:cell division protein FtsZ [Sulfurospirillum diekertiae]|uniref:Cell division protein FtsZ n=1 Tax=Sulfurospirillum diekertiae TaxID=1854492 RepID=A0A1Y0HLT3_9BACT|nr:cell division protein FtsZ [Sulfurospirillum diekertiae]ARU49042.1 Cell division protein FtsZ [Sulfurospirillum diekertiae]ASC93859.1 Cell division protein FtsZ [Sulfurospirillum diekertiae]
MNGFSIEESKCVYGAKIKVIGVGGGGGNMINHMVREGISGIDLIAANTDAQALENCLAKTKIQLGKKGLGAGMRPEIGKESALESYEEIKSSLEKADIVFIASGFGGGTGTGAAPIVAQAAKEVGALTVAVVTRPFMFEGKKRAKLAEMGINELRKESDSIVIIPNDKLLSIVDAKFGIKDSFRIVDDVLSRAVSGMSLVVLSSGQSDINVDFADVQTVMSHRGMALMGIGESTGDDAAIEAIKSAIESPLLDNMSINGALGVLVHFQIPASYPITEISNAMSLILDCADEDADVIFGTTTSEDMPDNSVRVTIVATGFENKVEASKELKMLNNNQESIKKERILRMKKVSGGYEGQDDYLDIPTYIRHQMD